MPFFRYTFSLIPVWSHFSVRRRAAPWLTPPSNACRNITSPHTTTRETPCHRSHEPFRLPQKPAQEKAFLKKSEKGNQEDLVMLRRWIYCCSLFFLFFQENSVMYYSVLLATRSEHLGFQNIIGFWFVPLLKKHLIIEISWIRDIISRVVIKIKRCSVVSIMFAQRSQIIKEELWCDDLSRILRIKSWTKHEFKLCSLCC